MDVMRKSKTLTEKPDPDFAERKIAIIQAINAIRDEVMEPELMLSSIAGVLRAAFEAKLCAIYLLSEETGKLEISAAAQIPGEEDKISEINKLCFSELDRQTKEKNDGFTLASDGFSAIAIGIFLDGKRLGAILIAKTSPFDKSSLALLKTAGNQIGSAIIQNNEHHRLRQKEKVITAIAGIDQIRDKRFPFEKILERVIKITTEIISAELCFLMLYTRKKSLELKAITNHPLNKSSSLLGLIANQSEAALETGSLVNWSSGSEGKVKSLICLPLILKDNIIGIFGAINKIDKEKFSRDDEELLRTIAGKMDPAIFESLKNGK